MQIPSILWIQYGPDLEEFRFQHSFQGVEGNDVFNMNSLRFYNLGQTQNVPYYVYEQSWSINPNSGIAPKIFNYSGRDIRFPDYI